MRREGAFWPPARPGLRWSILDAGSGHRIAYLEVNRFDDGAAQLIDQAMQELGGTTGLIIDIRENSGGNTSALRLNSYFADEQPAVVLMSRPYLQRLGTALNERVTRAVPRVQGAYTTEAVFAAVERGGGAAAFWTEDVGERRYRAPVVVLIGENTGSAAEGFAWFMRTRTEARLVGRRSAGALLSGESFDLGDGWSVTVPVHGLWSPEGEDYGDRPVPPHIPVEWSRESLCAGRDPDVESALDLLAPPGAAGRMR